MLTESKWGIHISSSATIYVLVTSVINPHKIQLWAMGKWMPDLSSAESIAKN